MQIRMPINYNSVFNTAWNNYQGLAIREHAVIQKKFTPGFFTSFTQSNRDLNHHPAFKLYELINNPTLDGTPLREAFIRYLAENPPDDTFSFSSYLIDELMKTDPNGGWQLFEYNPIITCDTTAIPLYRGVKYDPDKAFANGLPQHYISDEIGSYTSSQNVGVGNSTSLNYQIAFDYAAPKKDDSDPSMQNARMHCKQLYGTSYVYIIHYRGKKSIHIPNTHLARSNFIQYATCFFEDEVNIAENIPSSDLYCAFEIDRGSRSIKNIIYNDHYIRDESTHHFEEQEKDKTLSLQPYNTQYVYHLIDGLNSKNIFSNLLAISSEFMKIKYDPTINDKSKLLKDIREKTFHAFLDFIDSLSNKKLEINILRAAKNLKIFSEHREDSLFKVIANTSAQNKLDEILASKIPTPKSSHVSYPSRAII